MIKNDLVTCQRCGTEIQSFSAMRKWCIDCRDRIRLEQARERKQKKRRILKVSRKTN